MNLEKTIPELYGKLVLTFDDGPVESNTINILDTIKLFSQKLNRPIITNFFINGYHLSTFSRDRGDYVLNLLTIDQKKIEILKRIIQDGHQISNHSFSHKSFESEYFLNHHQAQLNEILVNHQLLKSYMPDINSEKAHGRGWYFRSPGGSWNPDLARFYNEDQELRKYVGPIYWNVGHKMNFNQNGVPVESADWACKSNKKLMSLCSIGTKNRNEISYDQCLVEQCARGYLNFSYLNPHKGGIVLLHDLQPITVKMMPYLLRVWAGVNPYKEDSAIYKALENFVNKYHLEKFEPMEILSLDDVEYFNQWVDHQ